MSISSKSSNIQRYLKVSLDVLLSKAAVDDTDSLHTVKEIFGDVFAPGTNVLDVEKMSL